MTDIVCSMPECQTTAGCFCVRSGIISAPRLRYEALDTIAALTAERDALRHDVESAGALRLRMNAHRETAYKLRQQLSEAVAALEPFSNSDMTGYVELGMRDEDSCVSGVCDFTFGDLIRARKVHRKATERKPVEKQNSGDNP